VGNQRDGVIMSKNDIATHDEVLELLTKYAREGSLRLRLARNQLDDRDDASRACGLFAEVGVLRVDVVG
jgi:hypothetical protein